jgi:hypothetical protein
MASLEEAAEDGLLAMLTDETCAELLSAAGAEGCARVRDSCLQHALAHFEPVATRRRPPPAPRPARAAPRPRARRPRAAPPRAADARHSPATFEVSLDK